MTKLARPLPLEYLIIELTTSTPRSPTPLLPGGQGSFPVENRDIQVHIRINKLYVITVHSCVFICRILTLYRSTSELNRG